MTKLTLIALTLMVLLLSSCGKVDRWWASWTGNSEVCIDGVTYIQFISGASVKYNTNGTIATCQ